MVVFDDADPAAVAEGIKIAGYWNSGQDCTAGSRVIAGPKIYDALLEALVPAVESLKVGDPAEGEDDRDGPGHLEGPAGPRARLPRAREGGDGAHRRRANGERGLFVQPTVVTGVAQGDEIVQNEVFGPVVTVQKFADDARRSRGRTTSATGSPRRSGRATSAGR